MRSQNGPGGNMKEELKLQIDDTIKNSKEKNVWKVYEECKKIIKDSPRYIEELNYIIDKLKI